MDSENTLRTMTHGSKVVPAASMVEKNPVDRGNFNVNRMSGKPSLTSSYGGGRSQEKK